MAGNDIGKRKSIYCSNLNIIYWFLFYKFKSMPDPRVCAGNFRGQKMVLNLLVLSYRWMVSHSVWVRELNLGLPQR